MPRAVYILGLAIFAQGTSELMLAGLLPEIATDLGVSIPDAGLLISGFAVGMLVGAPVLAVATLRLPRRTTLLALLAVFAATHAIGALAPGYGLLMATRVVGAFAYAGFWAVAAVTAIGLVAPTARGKAMAVVTGGLTVATIIGLPAGTVIGQHFGWRTVFWALAALAVLAMAGIRATIPAGGADGPAPRLSQELRTMARPRLWLAYATTALATGGLLATFAYLAPLLTGTSGLAPAYVPAVLALYGAGALIGITIGGRSADARPFATLAVSIAGAVLISAALALWAQVPVAAVVLAALLGAFGFGANPALNTRVFALAEGAPTLAAAVNISAFNVGITAGPWLGGLAIDAGAGYPSVSWVGAALALAALGVVAWSAALNRARATTPAGACAPAAPAA
ncbi:Cmx/CmrA family chloramphenicol efflux MFS transporter [Nocardiopsis sediminis]|uniref:Cmx/CmrA family chloramphenicol efflux MFS transporter n=1 Tax=Nocardiopsis sediminis TaxID=1778267 RepID=A0ABV8FDR7_9ACTN